MNAKTKFNPNETCESIKLGIDAHAKWYYVGRQATKRQYQQERQSESAGDARGDGLENDALATRLPCPAQVGAGSGEPEGECGGTKESGRGRRPSAGRGPVATVHRPNHRRESRADLLAGSGVNSEHRHLQTMI